MSKNDFMNQLEVLLRVKKEDKDSILEEYDSYFTEATSDGATEQEVVEMLETPKEIAATANDELGTTKSEDMKGYIKAQVDIAKKSIENSVDLIDIDGLVSNVNKTVSETMESIKKNSILEGIGEKMSEVIDKLKSIDYGKNNNGEQDYSNSKIDKVDIKGNKLIISINDENSSKIGVRITQGTEQELISMTIPNIVKNTFELIEDGETVQYLVPKTSIQLAQRKRVKLLIPTHIEDLTINSKCPLSVKGIELENLAVKVNNVPVSISDIEGGIVELNMGNGPLSVKDLEVDKFYIDNGNGPVSIKNIESEEIRLECLDGPISIKDVESDEFVAKLGSGPLSIKDMKGVKHSYSMGSGPKSIKDIDVEDLLVEASGGIISMRDVKTKLLDGDITGSVKSLRRIDAEVDKLRK